MSTRSNEDGNQNASRSPKNRDSEKDENHESSSSSSAVEAGLSLSGLQRYLTEKLFFLGLEDNDADSSIVKILDDVSLDGIVDYIKKKGCKNIITMAGAGISTYLNASVESVSDTGTCVEWGIHRKY